MKTLNLLMVVAGLVTLVGSAEAKGRKAKAVICESYAIVPDAHIAELEVVVCYDHHTEGGLVLRYWQEIVLPGPDGLKKVAVGYR